LTSKPTCHRQHTHLFCSHLCCSSSFSFHPTSPTELYPLSLHDALPISTLSAIADPPPVLWVRGNPAALTSRAVAIVSAAGLPRTDRKSTRLNSSHDQISYAVFCLKKKKKKK